VKDKVVFRQRGNKTNWDGMSSQCNRMLRWTVTLAVDSQLSNPTCSDGNQHNEVSSGLRPLSTERWQLPANASTVPIQNSSR